MIDNILLDSLGDHWMLRYDNDGKSYGGYKCAPVGEWNTCPKWNENTKADCESGGFFGQGPQASGYLHDGTRVCFCETRGPMCLVDDVKVKWREFRVLYTQNEALAALNYVTGGRWAGSLRILPRLTSTTLTTVGGDCVLHEGASAPALTTVGGDCFMYYDASAPALTTVGGYCALRASAPALTTVGSNCYLDEGASAPALTTVKGDCTLDEGASAPMLKRRQL